MESLNPSLETGTSREGPIRPPSTRARRCVALAGLAFVACLSGCDQNELFSGPPLTGNLPNVNPCPPQRTPSQLKVKINEVMVENVSTLEDERGGYPPWVELYNNTDEEMDLGAVALSTDILDPDPWRIPCVDEAVVPARGHLVIFLDGDTEDELDFHADFTLEAGKQFQLVINKGSDFFSFDASKLAPDQSAGRYPDANSKVDVLREPTPRAPNAEYADAPPAEGTFLRGDANGDSRVNISDMSAVLGVLFQGKAAPACEDQLDTNDDGAVDIADATYIGNALFLHGATFPPPFPSTGPDPTPDALGCPL